MRLLERLREGTAGRLGERPAFCSGGGDDELGGSGGKVRATAAMLARGRGPVVVYGHKEPWMPACFLACLLAGRPHLPADRSWPHERVRRAAELARATLLLAVEPMKLPGLETWDRGRWRPSPTLGHGVRMYGRSGGDCLYYLHLGEYREYPRESPFPGKFNHF